MFLALKGIAGFAVMFWAWTIVSVAVFAVPNQMGGLQAVFGSLLVVVLGFVVPAGFLIYLFRPAVPGRFGAGAIVQEQGPAWPRAASELPAAGLVELAEPLSPRELEVLRRLANGDANQQIARSLVVEVATVKTHTNNIYRKLGVRNRTEAVALALKRGMLPALTGGSTDVHPSG